MTFRATVRTRDECVLGQSATHRLCGDSLTGCRLTEGGGRGGVALIGVNATGTRKAVQSLTRKHCKNTQKPPPQVTNDTAQEAEAANSFISF